MNDKKAYDFTDAKSAGNEPADPEALIDGWEAYEKWLEMMRGDLAPDDQGEPDSGDDR